MAARMICSQQRCELGRRRVIEMLVDADQCGMLGAGTGCEEARGMGRAPYALSCTYPTRLT